MGEERRGKKKSCKGESLTEHTPQDVPSNTTHSDSQCMHIGVCDETLSYK